MKQARRSGSSRWSLPLCTKTAAVPGGFHKDDEGDSAAPPFRRSAILPVGGSTSDCGSQRTGTRPISCHTRSSVRGRCRTIALSPGRRVASCNHTPKHVCSEAQCSNYTLVSVRLQSPEGTTDLSFDCLDTISIYIHFF